MSQRTFNHGKFEVVTGYDRPLRRFFLTVYEPDGDGEDEPVFMSLDLPGAAMTLEQIQKQLFLMGIEPPETLFADLEKDQFLEYPESNLRMGYPRKDAA